MIITTADGDGQCSWSARARKVDQRSGERAEYTRHRRRWNKVVRLVNSGVGISKAKGASK